MMIRFAAIAATFALTLAACAPTAPSGSGAAAPALAAPIQMSLGQSVDIAAAGTRLAALRATHGLSRPLGHSAALQAAAQGHADDMARTGNFGHTGARGSTLRTRLRAANYGACFGAENIAAGQGSAAQVFQDWMGSPGHRRNILAPQATQFGFARNGGYWVLVVGRNC